jgi:hypothetical protein
MKNYFIVSLFLLESFIGLGQCAITSQPLATQSVCQNGATTPLEVTNDPPAQCTSVCSGGGGQGIASYQWFVNNINSTSGAQLIVGANSNIYVPASNLVGTSYYYCEISIDGCVWNQTIIASVTVNPLPSISGLQNQVICNGDQTTLTALGMPIGGGYGWSTGAINSSIVINPSLTNDTVTDEYIYQVYYYDLNGCFAIDSVSVIVNPTPVISIPSSVSVCSNAPESIISTVNLPGGSYLWSNGATTSNITVNPSTDTMYSVTYNLNGCLNSSSPINVYVNNPLVVNLGPDISTCYSFNSNPVLNGAVLIQGSIIGAGSFYSYSWSTNGTGYLDTLLQPTPPITAYLPSQLDLSNGQVIISLTSDDPSGPCSSSSDELTIFFYEPATVDAGNNQNLCLQTDSVFLNGLIGGDASSVNWSGGSGVFIDNNDLNNVYLPSNSEINSGYTVLYLTTNDPVGACLASTDSIQINFNIGTTNSQTNIFVYQDTNVNCQNDNEIGLQGIQISIQPGNYIATSSASGIASFDSLPDGIYTATIDTTNLNWSTSCPGSQTFSIQNGTADCMSFGLTNNNPCTDPEVSIYAPFLRRCLPNQNVYVTACNQTTATGALNASYVDVELDPLMTVTASSLPYTAQGNNIYRFQTGNLNPGQCASFNITTTISCNAMLGQTLCMDANLLPVESCALDTEPTPMATGVTPCNLPWDQSSLSVDGWCQGDSVYFTITNTGQLGGGDMECYSPVRVYVDGVLTYFDSIMIQGGTTVTYSYFGNGQTWILQADQHPLHPGNSHPNAHVEGCGDVSNWTPDLVNNFPQDDADPVVDIYCGWVTGAWDPNDKRGYPTGIGATNDILPNTDLQYVIRFQNTGTDTAFTVVIRDTLDIDLNIFTVTSGVSSHNYSFTMHGPRVLEWTFNNINLPDSSANEPESHGFVTFQVKQVPDYQYNPSYNKSVYQYNKSNNK